MPRSRYASRPRHWLVTSAAIAAVIAAAAAAEHLAR